MLVNENGRIDLFDIQQFGPPIKITEIDAAAHDTPRWWRQGGEEPCPWAAQPGCIGNVLGLSFLVFAGIAAE